MGEGMVAKGRCAVEDLTNVTYIRLRENITNVFIRYNQNFKNVTYKRVSLELRNANIRYIRAGSRSSRTEPDIESNRLGSMSSLTMYGSNRSKIIEPSQCRDRIDRT